MAQAQERAERRRAPWLVVVTVLAVGLGLIAMHAGAASAGHDAAAQPHHPSEAAHLSAVLERVDRVTSVCMECTGNAGMPMTMTVVCAVLLLAVASGLGQLVRRLLRLRGRTLAALLRPECPCWLQPEQHCAQPPDLHALQVMRC